MNFLPSIPKLIEKKDNWGHFEIEALYPGYGMTVGNSLRRVLLSSLQGAAVTQVKIKGVSHEFSTMPGVLEDTVVIIMNLKQMRFKMHSQEPQKAVLKIKGEKEVKASDFKYPSQVELVNKSCHIATLTDKKAELEMEIQIEQGVGYEPVERRRKQEKLEIGVMPLDSIFTPIKRVNFKVQNMRVGDRTDFDRLYLDIETDGTITPEQALAEACEILVQHFSLFAQTFKVEESGEEKKSSKKVPTASGQAEAVKENQEDINKRKVEDLKLSVRTLNALSEGGVKTVGGILKKGEQGILELEGMGEKGLKETRKALKKLGLEF